MDAPAVVIRRAEPADAPALTALARAAKATWGYPVDWLERWTADLTITAAYIERHAVLVATSGGTPIAVTAVETGGGGEEAILAHAWVNPAHQRQGVGRTLVLQALTEAARAGATSVRVLADPNAEAFYRSLGAVPAGATPAPMPGAPDRVLPNLEFRL